MPKYTSKTLREYAQSTDIDMVSQYTAEIKREWCEKNYPPSCFTYLWAARSRVASRESAFQL